MISLAGKRVTVAGLGRFGGGIAVSRWLCQQGARVLVTDQATADSLVESQRQLDGLDIQFHLGRHCEEDFTQTDLVVASPAIPPANPFLQAARIAGVPVTTEIRLFIERCPAPIIAITGTKGKSTTTAMLGRMLQQKFTTWVGGNIGKSLLFDLPEIHADHLVVLELSSFMLEYLEELRWSPHVGLVTMIAPDHLDRHGTQEAYLSAKKNLLRFQKADDWAVLNRQCPHAPAFASVTAARVVYYPQDGFTPFSLIIPGQHNQINAQGAFAAAATMGITHAQAQAALADFPGLPHRLRLVHEQNGVRYFNDSIATIPQAAVAAMESFPPGKVIQIIGGYDKHLDMSFMCRAIASHAKAALCIGATGPNLVRLLLQAGTMDPSRIHDCQTLDAAMKIAGQLTTAGDVVLLSTGCASYDQFMNFEKRGEIFAQMAKNGSINA